MSGGTDGGVMLPRELVLASAGSGKTFRISSRIIGLLAHGESPDAVLASTFTRKAAGEILGRVLVRLAEAGLDPEEAAELARHAALAPGDGPVVADGARADRAMAEARAMDGAVRETDDGRATDGAGLALDCDRCLELLADLVRRLHRLHISTLDAFFIRAARNFSHELDLPPAWTIADTPTYERLRAEALQDMLRRADPGALIELLRLANRGRASRSIHGDVFRDLDDLHRIHHELDPTVDDPWDVLADRVDPDADEADADRIAEAIEALEAPTTTGGEPSKAWVGALDKAADRLRARDWEGFLSGGLAAKILGDGEPTYYRRPIPPHVLRVFADAIDLVRGLLAGRLARQAKALGRLVALYDEAFARRQRIEGAYRFEDVTRMLGAPDPLGERLDLYYRLDMRTRHLLLDEFQDTSTPQWRALRPLADELLSGEEGARAAVVVADPKQSIYGWRGATPALVHHIGDWYSLRRDGLARSWRSSQVVLDVVNRVFADIEASPVLDDADRDVAVRWARSFEPHEAARGLPGYVRVAVGPEDEGRSEHRPRLLAHTAELVRELRDEAPGCGIGVLTRQNKAVARLIYELRRRGVPASEEGGNPLTDAASVAAVLALLRLADHPGDRIARYHVARSPVGDAVGGFVGVDAYDDPEDDHATRRLTHRIRGRLIRDGYGSTLDALARSLVPSCDRREADRLMQLVELGFRYDDEATLRPVEFVRRVEAERVEDPSDAGVRVMTVHQSKGLEFDIVVLPELDARIFRGGGAGALPFRDDPTGPVQKVYPYVGSDLRRLFPEIEAAYRQSRASVLRDALSGLYVAMTRARYALHIVVKPDGGSGGGATSAAAIVRHALAPDREAVAGDDAFFTHGDPRWFEGATGATDHTDEARGAASAAERSTPLLRPSPARRARVLPRRSPSGPHDDEAVDLADVLRLDRPTGREHGTIVHAWCEEIGWIGAGPPDDDRLREIAVRIAPRRASGEIQRLIDEFRGWLEQPTVRDALRRRTDRGEPVLEREIPFARRTDDAIVQGVIDRLVVWEDDSGRTVAAEVLDFKTDDVDPAGVDERAERYRPQLEVYREAVAGLYDLEPASVEAKLLFLRPGVAVPVQRRPPGEPMAG